MMLLYSFRNRFWQWLALACSKHADRVYKQRYDR
ncbi:hypothetical protein GGQ79_002596 [Ochrobactrum pecoris]|uniref:Uncharacterized protein n=1 Tax=Brucella pecoris TaxID=867683 RepID=A0AB34YSQ5_9HYPH|nr:hypothetical protein [Brucella pecoris]